MNCYNHPDRPAAGFCRTCGRPLCTACQRPAEGTLFCPDHVPVAAQGGYGAGYGSYGADAAGNPTGSNPYAQAPYPSAPPPAAGLAAQTSPLLAFILGFIPGVGAIYNGQYIKGLIHAGIFGLIVTLISTNENGPTAPLFGILLSAFVFYMPFEAYHTAKRRQSGLPVEEWSSLSRGPVPAMGGRTAVGPIILIGIGVLFLLDTMNLIEFRQIGRFWPVILIAIGASMLYSRMNSAPQPYYQPGSTRPANPPNVPPAGAPPTAPTPGASGNELMETGRE